MGCPFSCKVLLSRMKFVKSGQFYINHKFIRLLLFSRVRCGWDVGKMFPHSLWLVSIYVLESYYMGGDVTYSRFTLHRFNIKN